MNKERDGMRSERFTRTEHAVRIVLALTLTRAPTLIRVLGPGAYEGGTHWTPELSAPAWPATL